MHPTPADPSTSPGPVAAATDAPPAVPLRRAVFLDRDGTLIHDPGYLAEPERRARCCPEVPDALRALADAGFALVVCTNQSGIARGKYSVEQYERVARALDDAARGGGRARSLASYYCPYHPEGVVAPYARDHEDRKPAPGMWLRAAATTASTSRAPTRSATASATSSRASARGRRRSSLAAGRDKWPLPVGGPSTPTSPRATCARR